MASHTQPPPDTLATSQQIVAGIELGIKINIDNQCEAYADSLLETEERMIESHAEIFADFKKRMIESYTESLADFEKRFIKRLADDEKQIEKSHADRHKQIIDMVDIINKRITLLFETTLEIQKVVNEMNLKISGPSTGVNLNTSDNAFLNHSDPATFNWLVQALAEPLVFVDTTSTDDNIDTIRYHTIVDLGNWYI